MLKVKVLAHTIGIAGWKMLFRGTRLSGIARCGGTMNALWMQVIPFFQLHAHKPDTKLMVSRPDGCFAECFSLGSRSFMPFFLLHSIQLGSFSVLGYALQNV